MTLSLLASKTTYNSGATPVSSFSINAPSGIVQNNLIWVQMTVTGGTGMTVTPPAGFTFRLTGNSTTVFGVRAYTKIATNSEPSSYTFTLSGPASVAANALAWSGNTTNFPVTTSNSSTSTAASTTASFSIAIGQTVPGYALKLIGSYSASSGSVSMSAAGTGWTTETDVNNSAASSDLVQNAMLDGPVSTNLRAFTVNSSTLTASVDSNIMVGVFIREDKTTATYPVIDYSTTINNTISSYSITHNASVAQGQLGYAIISLTDSTASVSSIVGTGLTWSFVTSSLLSGTGKIELWSTTFPGVPAIFTSTVTLSTTVNSQATSLILAGASGTGAINTTSNSTGAFSSSLNTTKDDSWVYSIVYYNANTAYAPNTGLTSLTAFSLPGSTQGVNMGYSSALTQNAGTSVTHSVSTPTTTSYAAIQWEVLATPSVQNQTGVSRIQLITARTQTGLARITATITKTQTGKSRIALVTARTQPGKANIKNTTSRTQTGKTYIGTLAVKTQTGKANIRNNTLRTQPGKADIKRTTTAAQLGKSAIVFTAVKTIQAKANIGVKTSRLQTGKARVIGGVDISTKPSMKGVSPDNNIVRVRKDYQSIKGIVNNL